MSSRLQPKTRILIPVAEELRARQRREDERALLSSALGVRYRQKSDSLELEMRSGLHISIPRGSVRELEGIAAGILIRELRVAGGGEVISLPSHDVDISIPGLLRDLLGFDIQRKGGEARTKAKAIAAKLNGAKGGRPRKPAATPSG